MPTKQNKAKQKTLNKYHINSDMYYDKKPFDELDSLHDAKDYQPNVQALSDKKAAQTIVSMIESAHKGNRTAITLSFTETDPLFCGLADYVHRHKQQFEDKHFTIEYEYPYASLNDASGLPSNPKYITISWGLVKIF